MFTISEIILIFNEDSSIAVVPNRGGIPPQEGIFVSSGEEFPQSNL